MRATAEEANRVLEEDFLPWWETNCTVKLEHRDDAHRALDGGHNLDAILSMVQRRQVMRGDYTFRFDNQLYQIERADIVAGLRGARVRIEQRLDGSMAVAFQGKYLRYQKCETAVPVREARGYGQAGGEESKPSQRSSWMKDFHLERSLPVGRPLVHRGPLAAQKVLDKCHWNAGQKRPGDLRV